VISNINVGLSIHWPPVVYVAWCVSYSLFVKQNSRDLTKCRYSVGQFLSVWFSHGCTCVQGTTGRKSSYVVVPNHFTLSIKISCINRVLSSVSWVSASLSPLTSSLTRKHLMPWTGLREMVLWLLLLPSMASVRDFRIVRPFRSEIRFWIFVFSPCLLPYFYVANATEEFFVRRRPLYEVVGQMGMWGLIINSVQATILERNKIPLVPWGGDISE